LAGFHNIRNAKGGNSPVIASRTLPALAGALVLVGAACGADLTVKVTGFHNQKGNAIVYLWTAADGFPSKTEKASVQKSVPIPGDSVTVIFNDVAPGTYAVSVTHDENGNGKMDTGFMGKPKEGYGASNNPQNKLSAPSFDQCKFNVDQGGKSLDIALRY
jgi:uncharacterized protein (DUF2141 family)